MKKHLFFFLFNFFIALILATLLELLLGFWLSHPQKIPNFLKDIYIAYYQFQDRAIIQVADCGQYDKDLFYTLKPGECQFDNREFSVKYNINQIGVRDDKTSLDFPSIVFLGDSFTMGWGVEEDKIFPQLVEEQLKYNVLNTGISSFGTAREMELLKRINTDSLKYMIIQYHPTDYTENLDYLEKGNRLVISKEEDYNNLKDYIQGRQKYFPGKHIAYVAKYTLVKLTGDIEDGSVRYDDKEEARLFINSLINAEFDFNNIQIFAFEVESFNKNDDLFIKELRNQIQQKEYPSYIQKMQTFALANILTDEDYFILDDHINERGHAKIAQEILKNIQPYLSANK